MSWWFLEEGRAGAASAISRRLSAIHRSNPSLSLLQKVSKVDELENEDTVNEAVVRGYRDLPRRLLGQDGSDKVRCVS